MTDTSGDSSEDWPPPQPPEAPRPTVDPATHQSSAGWSPAGPSLSVSYQLTEDEVVTALRWEAVHNRRVQVMLGCAALILLCGVVALAGDSSDGAGWFLIAAGGYIAVLMGYMVVRGPHRSWRRSIGLRGPQSLMFSEAGVEVRTTVAESKAKWDLYSGTYETPDAYLVRLVNRRVYYIFPKRIFRSSDEEMTFRDLLTRHTDAHLK